MYNVFYVIEYLFVGEPHYVVTYSFQSCFPNLVFFLLFWLSMISPVNFYDQTSVARNEIYDIISYDMLAKEILPARFLIPKVFPKP